MDAVGDHGDAGNPAELVAAVIAAVELAAQARPRVDDGGGNDDAAASVVDLPVLGAGDGTGGESGGDLAAFSSASRSYLAVHIADPGVDSGSSTTLPVAELATSSGSTVDEPNKMADAVLSGASHGSLPLTPLLSPTREGEATRPPLSRHRPARLNRQQSSFGALPRTAGKFGQLTATAYTVNVRTTAA